MRQEENQVQGRPKHCTVLISVARIILQLLCTLASGPVCLSVCAYVCVHLEASRCPVHYNPQVDACPTTNCTHTCASPQRAPFQVSRWADNTARTNDAPTRHSLCDALRWAKEAWALSQKIFFSEKMLICTLHILYHGSWAMDTNIAQYRAAD